MAKVSVRLGQNKRHIELPVIQCKCELNIGGNNMCLLNYNKKIKKI